VSISVSCSGRLPPPPPPTVRSTKFDPTPPSTLQELFMIQANLGLLPPALPLKTLVQTLRVHSRLGSEDTQWGPHWRSFFFCVFSCVLKSSMFPMADRFSKGGPLPPFFRDFIFSATLPIVWKNVAFLTRSYPPCFFFFFFLFGPTIRRETPPESNSLVFGNVVPGSTHRWFFSPFIPVFRWFLEGGLSSFLSLGPRLVQCLPLLPPLARPATQSTKLSGPTASVCFNLLAVTE